MHIRAKSEAEGKVGCLQSRFKPSSLYYVSFQGDTSAVVLIVLFLVFKFCTVCTLYTFSNFS